MKNFLKNFGIFALFFIYSSYLVLIPLNIYEHFTGKTILQSGFILFITDMIFIILILLFYKKDLLKELKDLKTNYKKYIDITIRAWLIGLAIMTVSNLIINLTTSSDIANNEESIRQLFALLPIYTLFTTIIYAPIVEELVFRKAIRGLIKSKWIFIIFSGFVFGLSHVVFGMDSLTSLLYIIPYGVLGGAFAYIYQKTNNIFTTILIHFVHNLTLMILLALL